MVVEKNSAARSGDLPPAGCTVVAPGGATLSSLPNGMRALRSRCCAPPTRHLSAKVSSVHHPNQYLSGGVVLLPNTYRGWNTYGGWPCFLGNT